MSLNLASIITAVAAHAVTTGLFDRVQYAEQINRPNNGLQFEAWLDAAGPAPGMSGLAATSGRVALIARLTIPIARDRQTEIDTDMAAAVGALFAAYSGDFTLGGLVTQVDLLGAHGVPLSGRGGALAGPPGSKSGYRNFDITLPVIVNDLWPQSE